MADYKISLEARKNLRDIYRYGFETYGMARADEFFGALFECFECIAENPTQYPTIDYIKPGYRKFIFRRGKSRTMIFYRMTEDGAIEIMHLIGRQDFP